MEPYKVAQREAEKAVRSHYVLHRGPGDTSRVRSGQNRVRGKAAIKAAKRATHTKDHYFYSRYSALINKIKTHHASLAVLQP